MFVVSTLEADVKVAPKDLTKPPLTAVTEVLEALYLDRAVPGLGLAVSVYDVLSVQGGHIYPNDGAAYFRARFRLVVFRPFVGEILVGTLRESSKQGVRVSLGFFDDVQLPDVALQEPSVYDEAEGAWYWDYEGNRMYMDVGEEVRLRVSGVTFPPPPPPGSLKPVAEGEEPPLGSAARPYAPMVVLGDVNGDGLGLTSWWGGGGDDEGGEEEEGGE